MPKTARREQGTSAKQAAFIKKLQAMAERATAHACLGTGAKVLGIYGSGRFFDGVDEVEPALILHIVAPSYGGPEVLRRRYFLQWVWLAVMENKERRITIEAEAKRKWEAKVADHPIARAVKEWKEAFAAYRAGAGPHPGFSPEQDDTDLSLLFPHCDDEYKAATDVDPLGTVGDGCAWAVRQLAAGVACHDGAGTGTRGETRASWSEMLAAFHPLNVAAIAALAAEWGNRLTWKQARNGGGYQDFPQLADLACWYLTRNLGRFRDLKVTSSALPPEGHMLWTRDHPEVAGTMASIFGAAVATTTGSGGGGGGGSSSSSAQEQEIGLALWKLAHLRAWQAMLEVAVRQLLTPCHPLHAQMAEGARGTFLFKCPIFTETAERAAMAVVSGFGATMTSLITLQKDETESEFSSRLCGVLVDHAGLGAGSARAADLLEMKMSAFSLGRFETVALFPAPAAETLAKIAAERPRSTFGLSLKKLQADLRPAQLLVDGLAALVGHSNDLHAATLLPCGHVERNGLAGRWERMLGQRMKYNQEQLPGDSFELLRWPICGSLHYGLDGLDRLSVELPFAKGAQLRHISGPSGDVRVHRLLHLCQSGVAPEPAGQAVAHPPSVEERDSLRKAELRVRSDRGLNGPRQQIGEQLDEGMRLTLPRAGQLVVNECALALLALRATASKVGPASAVSRALVQLTIPTTDVEAFRRLHDPAAAGLRAHLWQHRRPFFLVRVRAPQSILGMLPLDLFELVLTEFIGTGYAPSAYAPESAVESSA
jgi:hypothetical protein